jgi:cytochrome c-type biogenesis protein CcmH
MNSALWFVAGFVAGILAAVLLRALWRRVDAFRRSNLLRFGLPLAGALVAASGIALMQHPWTETKPTAATAIPVQDAAAMQASHATAIEDYQRNVARDPRDAASWLGLANLYRRERQFDQARDAFAHLSELNAMTADTWADYADVEASVSGSLAGKAETYIDRALAQDPDHAKALWLKASLAHEQGKDVEALALWKHLHSLLPAGSSDAKLVEDNMAEAERLSGSHPAQSQPASAAAVSLSGTVAIDPKLAAQVKPGTPVFVFARAVGASGPPVAVMRATSGTWPLRFSLDDSSAMMPDRKLSDFETVTVEARVAFSGDATPQSGDLYAAAMPVRPREGKPLALTISQVRN